MPRAFPSKRYAARASAARPAWRNSCLDGREPTSPTQPLFERCTATFLHGTSSRPIGCLLFYASECHLLNCGTVQLQNAVGADVLHECLPILHELSVNQNLISLSSCDDGHFTSSTLPDSVCFFSSHAPYFVFALGQWVVRKSTSSDLSRLR